LFHAGLHHPGLALIASKTIAQHDLGAQVRALSKLLQDDPDLTDQVIYLTRP
jgi:hypothetical protein